MKSNAEITIITPVWNGLPYLRECVESVIKQKFQNWEMIISDDGSNDGTRDYLDTISDSRIKVFKQEKNQGIFGNLNFTFSKAQAPVCQILCQDDYMINDDSLDTIVNYWKNASPDIGLVRFNHTYNLKYSLTAYQQKVIPAVIESKNSDVLFYAFGNILGNLSNVAVRTSIVEESGFFNGAYPYAGDYEFWIRAGRKFNIGIQNESVIFVRRHEGTASVSLNRKGELLSQKSAIVSELFNNISNQYRDVNFILKLHGTINYDALQRDTAVRLWLKGKADYIKELDRISINSIYIFSGFFRWLVFFLSIGGRFGRVTIAKRLLKSTLEK
ncbi:Glycosyltransferase involved in cell wall bisynthesis [Mucilaginibacter pineti]|uniref:Glycosyltransferase involved in cell wall bisynthesis n=1 Tax=Mucilaginibacter pineti TaxID=1391627 RepID=A0A1G6W932_9SPHI|nr:glycosyltransferase [Mucilaginibacter pineti]SDD62203.1 Glycosyltransferase involved in cell wall bisynthesis [Mucilaginibacter pineti]